MDVYNSPIKSKLNGRTLPIAGPHTEPILKRPSKYKNALPRFSLVVHFDTAPYKTPTAPSPMPLTNLANKGKYSLTGTEYKILPANFTKVLITTIVFGASNLFSRNPINRAKTKVPAE